MRGSLPTTKRVPCPGRRRGREGTGSLHFLNEEGCREGLIPDRRVAFRSPGKGGEGKSERDANKSIERRKVCMQGLEVHLAIQGRLVGRGRGNCLQSRRPAPLPTMLGFLSSSSCSRSGSGGGGDGGWCVVRRRGVVGGAMHPGSCSQKATLGRGGDRERPSSIPSLALKPEQLKIICVHFLPSPTHQVPGRKSSHQK